jgi:hypothetical protein
MRLVLMQREQGRLLYGVIYGIIALCAIAAARYLPILGALPSCVFRSLTGISCPTCGSTRALSNLAAGELAAALSMNPLFVLLVLSGVAWLVLDIVHLLFRPRVPALVLAPAESTALRVLAFLLFLANWVFLVVRH